jgi:hypothetical protein
VKAEFTDTPHEGAADEIERLAGALLSHIRGGGRAEAEEARQELISSCRRLKDEL